MLNYIVEDLKFGNGYDYHNCVSNPDHLSFYSKKEFYLFVESKYKIGMHFSGPTYYFSANSDTYSVQIIPPFEFVDIKNVLNKIISLRAFL
jgi:hypothetical protein